MYVAVMVLGILYLCGFQVGKALGICSIILGVLKIIEGILKSL